MSSREQTKPPHKFSGWFAFAIYLALSMLFFGRGLIGHFSDRLIGAGSDPALFVFFLTWIPYAIVHHMNPFITHSIWTPHGFNLAWSTFVPLASLAMAPITLWTGPVPAYNLAMLLCPPLSALTAFLLCRKICGRFWPALAGGYVYGFSAYMLCHLLGHLTLVMAFFPPLAIYLVVCRLDGQIGALRCALLLALVLIGQIGSSIEMLAMMTVFGSIALTLDWSFGNHTARGLISSLAAPIASAYAIAAIAASPYLYYFFGGGTGPPEMATDLARVGAVAPANLAIPSPVNALGIFGWTRALSAGQNVYETSAYIGLPMILLLWSVVRSHSHIRAMKLAIWMFAIVSVASFGTHLAVLGTYAILMPWKLFTYLPLLDKAEPGRFTIFGFLCLAIILSLWLSRTSIAASTRRLVAAVTLIFMLPNPAASYWAMPTDVPAFFASGAYRHYLAPGDNVLILPYGPFGNVELWQAQCWMYFRTAGGYVGLSPAVPAQYQAWPIVDGFYNLAEIPDLTVQVDAFLVQMHVKAVIVADGGAHLWSVLFGQGPLAFRQRAFNADELAVIHAMFSPLDPSPIKQGGVTLYRVPLESLARYAHVDPRELERRAAEAKLRALIRAADRYMRQNKNPRDLNPTTAARLGLLPKLWLSGPNTESELSRHMVQNGLALGSVRGTIVVGLHGSLPVLTELAQVYGKQAANFKIFPPMLAFSPAEQTQHLLLFAFNRDQLSRAASGLAKISLQNLN
jgi:hypothetical protein